MTRGNVERERDRSIEHLLRDALKRQSASSSASCFDAETAAAWMDGALSASERAKAEEHAPTSKQKSQSTKAFADRQQDAKKSAPAGAKDAQAKLKNEIDAVSSAESRTAAVVTPPAAAAPPPAAAPAEPKRDAGAAGAVAAAPPPSQASRDLALRKSAAADSLVMNQARARIDAAPTIIV